MATSPARLAGVGLFVSVTLGLLAVATLAMGLYPKPFTDVMHSSVIELMRHVAISKL